MCTLKIISSFAFKIRIIIIKTSVTFLLVNWFSVCTRQTDCQLSVHHNIVYNHVMMKVYVILEIVQIRVYVLGMLLNVTGCYRIRQGSHPVIIFKQMNISDNPNFKAYKQLKFLLIIHIFFLKPVNILKSRWVHNWIACLLGIFIASTNN